MKVEHGYANELKRDYNYLMRHFKAVAFLDNQSIPIADREMWLQEYKNVLENLNRLLKVFGDSEILYTKDEALSGFYIEDKKEMEECA